MKATIVLVADDHGENFGRKLMLAAHRAGGVGFEMARLPQHVSLKQPFVIPSLEEMEEFFDGFAARQSPVTLRLEGLGVYPSDVIGGIKSGCMSVGVVVTDQLREMQKNLFSKLTERFGPCPAEHDDDYWFHMTVAIGGAPYENYLAAAKEVEKLYLGVELTFSRLGLLYYDDDNLTPGTYFCYKVAQLA